MNMLSCPCGEVFIVTLLAFLMSFGVRAKKGFKGLVLSAKLSAHTPWASASNVATFVIVGLLELIQRSA